MAGRLFDRHGGKWSIPLGFLVMALFATGIGVARCPLPTSGRGSVRWSSCSPEFHSAVGVVLVSLIGIALAIAASRSARTARPLAAEAAPRPADTAASIMKSDVYALSSTDTDLDAITMFGVRSSFGAPVLHDDGPLAGFLSDGDVMRYLSAAHPSSTSIYSYAIGTDDDLAEAMADLADLGVHLLEVGVRQRGDRAGDRDAGVDPHHVARGQADLGSGQRGAVERAQALVDVREDGAHLGNPEPC